MYLAVVGSLKLVFQHCHSLLCGLNYQNRMFTFCQYPFLLSMGSKMTIMASDAKRRMDIKMQKTIDALVNQKIQRAQETGLDVNGSGAFLTMAEIQQAHLLILRVHRNNLIEESLTQVWTMTMTRTGLRTRTITTFDHKADVLFSYCWNYCLDFSKRDGLGQVIAHRVHWRGRC